MKINYSRSYVKVIHAVAIAGRNFGFVTFSSTEAVDYLLDQREPVEVAGSRVTVRQVTV